MVHGVKWLGAAILVAGVAGAADLTILPKVINEGDSSTVTLRFQNQAGLPAAPESILVWVDEPISGQRLYGPVDPTPAALLNVPLPADANRIVDDTQDKELHIVTEQHTYPAGCTTACLTKVSSRGYYVRNQRVVVGGTPVTMGPTPVTPGP